MADSRLEDQPLAADTFARLPQGFCALVTGASGGIGRALIAELLAHPHCGKVLAVSRDVSCLSAHPELETLEADLTTEQGTARLEKWLAQQLDGESETGQPPALILNALGLLHDEREQLWPEKRLEDLSLAALTRLHQVNAFSPALLLGMLAPRLANTQSIPVAMTSLAVTCAIFSTSSGLFAAPNPML